MGFADDDALVERTYLKVVNLIKAVNLISEITGPIILLSSSFYLCNVCHAIFGNKAELNRHILTHAGSAKGGERMYSERRVPRGYDGGRRRSHTANARANWIFI